MSWSRNLFAFGVVFKLVITVVGNNDSKVYFPDDERNSQGHKLQIGVSQLPAMAPKELVVLRGTSDYVRYVDDIIAKGITQLTLDINNLLKIQPRNNENVLFSPLSITGALALVLLGSNGITFQQISKFWGLQIGISDIDKKSQIVHEQFARMLRKINQTSGFQLGHEVNVASAIFVQEGYPIRPIYRSTAEDLYQSSILNVDFVINPRGAQKVINDWVADRTNQKIKDILSDVPSSDTRVILTSALYFKAEWEHHFFPGSTKRRPFYVDGRKSKTNIEADMMANGGEFPYYKDLELGCEILGLRYKGGKSTMYVIMPFDSSRAKLREFESRLTVSNLNNLVSNTKTTGVVLLFPKMKIESTIDLKQTLKLLGVTSLFDPHEANLALLSPGFFQPKTQFKASTYIDNRNITGADQNKLNARIGENINLNANVPVGNSIPNMENRIGSSPLTIDNLRQLISEQENPGLYADKVIHKVFMDVTEKGTEAAAATSVSLSRDGSRVTFRVDVPFCFFIRSDETETILFWGSVDVPNPSYPKL